jgi:CRISPR-associated endoribonuclease Cas6
MDLLSLVFTLRPIPQANPTSAATGWWGRAAHALFLNTVREVDENLAASLHKISSDEDEKGDPSHNQVRPFSASTLMGHFNKGIPDPKESYTLRLTSFREDLTGIFDSACRDGSLCSGRTIELDYQPFEIQSVSPNQADTNAAAMAAASPWAARNSYQELSAPYLLGRIPAPRHISMQFTSPTTFKSHGMHMPIPLPGLVFGSLLERWNAYAPINFPAEVRRYAEECLAISQYDLETRPVPQKSRGLRVGAVGRVTYVAVNYDRYWMSLIVTLAAFSLYSGVGAGTTQGMGQCRPLPANLRSQD